MRPLRPFHKLHGALRILQICRDWPKWFREYFSGLNDGLEDYYRMRSGVNLYIRHNRSDFHMIDEIWAFRKYDYFGYQVKPGDVVVDIGANIGTFSLYAANACGASRVISFEPFPDNFRLLSKNMGQIKPGVATYVNQAVAGSRGTRSLKLDSKDPGSHTIVNGFGSSERTVEIQCCTFDDIFEQHSLQKIDYLKMDCEGAEYEILENAPHRLQQISRISMETHTTSDRKAEDLEKLLRSHRFDVRLFGGSRLYATRLS